jgi:hypothetical protein
MRRLLPLVAILLLLPACASTRRVELDELRASPPGEIRVGTRDGRTFRFERYMVADRALVALGSEESVGGDWPYAGTIPLRDVMRVETVDRKRDAFIVIGAAAAGAVLLSLLLGNGGAVTPIVR